MENLYLIDTPPPTISGSLHLGHIFSYTQADIMASFFRMKGYGLTYPFCFDNNGLPTEKLAQTNGIFDQKQIIDFSLDTSKKYKQLFDDIGIEFSSERYHTFSDTAQEIAFLSFEDLKKKGLIYKKETEFWWCPKFETSISQSELTDDGRFERSGEKAILKKGEGWFINIMDHLGEIKKMIHNIDWKPEHFKNRLLLWMDELQWDWSISRERNFGIQIPGETMTFDTWFISSLTPQLTWAAKTGEASLGCPIFDLRYQAHDIIRTWALFTIIKSLYHNEQIPWKTIMITGHALDENGDKFSKTKNNFIDPYHYINNYGPSGIRYWSMQNSIGKDILLNEKNMENAGRFEIKLKNARKFIDIQKQKGLSGINPEMENAWQQMSKTIDEHMYNFEWHTAFDKLYHFFWDEFCSKFIEQSKKDPAPDSLENIMGEMSEYFWCFFRMK